MHHDQTSDNFRKNKIWANFLPFKNLRRPHLIFCSPQVHQGFPALGCNVGNTREALDKNLKSLFTLLSEPWQYKNDDWDN